MITSQLNSRLRLKSGLPSILACQACWLRKMNDVIEMKGDLMLGWHQGHHAQLRKGCRVFCGTGAGPAHE